MKKYLVLVILCLALSVMQIAKANCASLNVRVSCGNSSFDESISRCWDWHRFSCQFCESKSEIAWQIVSRCGGSKNICVKATGGNFYSWLVNRFDHRCIQDN